MFSRMSTQSSLLSSRSRGFNLISIEDTSEVVGRVTLPSPLLTGNTFCNKQFNNFNSISPLKFLKERKKKEKTKEKTKEIKKSRKERKKERKKQRKESKKEK